jgi:hypothetical protein
MLTTSPLPGAFDVLGQLWPHIVMILYRLNPTKHLFLSRAFYATALFEAISPVFETAVVMWLFGSLWDRWTLQMKVITPILHVIFKASQIWGAILFWKLARKEEGRLARQKRGQSLTVEAAEVSAEVMVEVSDRESNKGSLTAIRVESRSPTTPELFV